MTFTHKAATLVPVMLRLLLTLSVLMLGSPPVAAQDTQPVAPVAVENLPAIDPSAPVVIELFSSQACVFCPRADRLFADLVKQDNIIGLACHVDYFDVKTGSLATPLCSQRQSWYESLLRAGPNYTPQMVMQGRIDAVGYKMDSVIAGIKKAQTMGTQPLSFTKTDKGYDVALPEGSPDIAGTVFLALIDKPHDLIIAEGRNKGQKMTYDNIAGSLEEMGPWTAGQRSAVINPAVTDSHSGFAVIVQDKETGKIRAAGKVSVGLGP